MERIRHLLLNLLAVASILLGGTRAVAQDDACAECRLQPPDRLEVTPLGDCRYAFLASGASSECRYLSVEWTFGDGTSAPGNAVTHVYTSPGNYVACVTYTVQGPTGPCTMSACTEVRVEGCDQNCRECGITPGEFIVEQLNRCSVKTLLHGSRSDCELVKYIYDFGDGTTYSSTNDHEVHTYLHDGIYTICVTEVYAHGDDVCSFTHCREVRIEGCHISCEECRLSVDEIRPDQIERCRWVFSVSSGSSCPGATYEWSFGDGTTASGSNIVDHTYTSSGTFLVCVTVTVQSSDGPCSETRCIEVRVEGCGADCRECDIIPGEFAVEQLDRCSVKTYLHPSSSRCELVKYIYDFGDGTMYSSLNTVEHHTYLHDGTYTICVTEVYAGPGGIECTYTYCREVRIEGCHISCEECRLRLEDIHATQIERCRWVFSIASSSACPGVTYDWSFGDGTTATGSNIVDHVFTGPGTYKVCVTVTVQSSDGPCSEKACIIVQVEDCGTDCRECGIIPGEFTVEQLNRCSVKTYLHPSSSHCELVKYIYDFGDGTVYSSLSPIEHHTYLYDGTYRICVTEVYAGPGGIECTYTYCREVRIEGCHISCEECRLEVSDIHVTEIERCRFGFGVSSSSSCPDATYTWSFGDGGTASGPLVAHTYTSSGTFLVCVTVTVQSSDGPCSETRCVEVRVEGCGSDCRECDIIPGEFAVEQLNRCSVKTYLHPSSSRCELVKYIYDFGDGTVYSSLNTVEHHTYLHDGTYTICVTEVYAGPGGIECTYTYCREVRIEGCHISCEECRLEVSDIHVTEIERCRFGFGVSSSSSCPDATYTWSFGDGGTASGPLVAHTYTSSGTFLVCVTVTVQSSDGPCSETRCVEVRVEGCGSDCRECDIIPGEFAVEQLDRCSVKTYLHPSSSRCELVKYIYDFGDGTVYSSLNTVEHHTYLHDGTYTICVTEVYAGPGGIECTYTYCREVRIEGCHISCEECRLEVSDIHVTEIERCRFGFGVSSSSSCPDATYAWSFGDGGTASGPLVDHTYTGSGTFLVCVTVTVQSSDGPCSETRCIEVRVEGCDRNCNDCAIVPGELTVEQDRCAVKTYLYGSASHCELVEYRYDFGDGTTFTSLDPVEHHIYLHDGTYTICVTEVYAHGDDVCTYTYCREVRIEGCHLSCEDCALRVGDIQVFQMSKCRFGFLVSSSTSCPGMTMEWNYGDGTSSTGTVGYHTYTAPGVYTVCVTVTVQSSDGPCTTTTCVDVDARSCNGERALTAEERDMEELDLARLLDLQRLSLGSTAQAWMVYPSLTEAGTTLNYVLPEGHGPLKFDLVDLQGRVLHTWTITVSKGTVELPGALAPGSYLIRPNTTGLDVQRIHLR